jgi:hypothetical protein
MRCRLRHYPGALCGGVIVPVKPVFGSIHTSPFSRFIFMSSSVDTNTAASSASVSGSGSRSPQGHAAYNVAMTLLWASNETTDGRRIVASSPAG